MMQITGSWGWGFAVLLLASAGGQAANAGGWPQKRGEGQVIITLIDATADTRFDADGDTISAAPFEKTELSALFEHGLTERLTFVAKPVFRTSQSGDPFGEDAVGFGASQSGVRYFFGAPWQGGVVSGQIVALVPGDGEDQDADPLGDVGVGGEVRALVGHGFSWGFVESQAALRDRSGAQSAEARLDLTVGVRAGDRLEFLGQSFSAWAVDTGAQAPENFSAHKVQLSAVGRLREGVHLQAGAYATVAGQEALQESAGVVSLWFRY